MVDTTKGYLQCGLAAYVPIIHPVFQFQELAPDGQWDETATWADATAHWKTCPYATVAGALLPLLTSIQVVLAVNAGSRGFKLALPPQPGAPSDFVYAGDM